MISALQLSLEQLLSCAGENYGAQIVATVPQHLYRGVQQLIRCPKLGDCFSMVFALQRIQSQPRPLPT